MKKNNIKDITMGGVICALYVALTLVNPLSYGIIQVRVSEGLAMLPFFNRKYIPSVVLGVVIANFFSPLGIFDVFAGLMCATVMYAISYFIKNKWLNALIYSVICGAFIGLELSLVLNVPFLMSFISVALSQVPIALAGVGILKIAERKIKI